MSLVKRAITVTFALGTGQFGAGPANQITLSGLHVAANILKAGGASMGMSTFRIYGMSLTLMNQLSTLGKQRVAIRTNTVTVAAGDATSGMSTVFSGNILDGYADFQSSPDVSFLVTGFDAQVQAVKPVAPNSYDGPVNAETVLAQLAQQIGFRFQNSGATAGLSSPYFAGTARDQIIACCRSVGFEFHLDTVNKVLAIWPSGGAVSGSPVMVSPATGLVGYPNYNSGAIVLKTLFNPALKYGAAIQVSSVVTAANGTWNVAKLEYDLESEAPNAPWFTTITAFPPGFTFLTSV